MLSADQQPCDACKEDLAIKITSYAEPEPKHLHPVSQQTEQSPHKDVPAWWSGPTFCALVGADIALRIFQMPMQSPARPGGLSPANIPVFDVECVSSKIKRQMHLATDQKDPRAQNHSVVPAKHRAHLLGRLQFFIAEQYLHPRSF